MAQHVCSRMIDLTGPVVGAGPASKPGHYIDRFDFWDKRAQTLSSD